MQSIGVSSLPQESALKTPSKEGLEKSRTHYERKNTFSGGDKEWVVGSKEKPVSGKPEQNIPTTVTVISKHTPRSDVQKSYRWVPNHSDMTGIRGKARITEMNNMKIFLDKIATPPKNIQAKGGILKGADIKTNKPKRSFSESSE